MKKKYLTLLSLLLSFILVSVIFTGCKSNTNKDLVKVRLNEVTRSIFYAPFYVAMNEGFFKEQGLDIDLTTGEGADAAITNTQVSNKTLLSY
jgi:NitT/TauT family transport system substrate-binding protein